MLWGDTTGNRGIYHLRNRTGFLILYCKLDCAFYGVDVAEENVYNVGFKEQQVSCTHRFQNVGGLGMWKGLWTLHLLQLGLQLQ